MICACPCGQEFEPRRSNQRYLSAERRLKDKNRRWPVKRQSLLPVPFRNGLGKHRKARTSGVTPLLGTKMADFLTTSEIAQILRISPWTLFAWRKAGKGPPFLKLSRNILRYPRRAFVIWMRQSIQGNALQVGTTRELTTTCRRWDLSIH